MIEVAANIERFNGFADLYDQHRAAPPSLLAEVLLRLAQTSRPSLVVDLGSGTGLSTRYWAERAGRVIGIEPGEEMRQLAQALTSAENITYQAGFSHATGLPDACTPIVTASQALHWMEPQPTFEEAARILVPGGVFAAFDYDWPPTTGCWQVDAAYQECFQIVRDLEKKLPSLGVKQWDKSQHLARMQASGCFRFTKEIVLHQVDQGNAERLLGLAASQGNVQTLLKHGCTQEEMGLDRLRQAAQRFLGSQPQTWYWSSRVRIGIV